jgi:hypothetical protein
MVKTIEEKPPEQVRRRRPSPRSSLATFEPFNLKRSSRCSSGTAYCRHMTPPRALPPLPAASLSGPFRLPAVLPEGRPPTGP